MNKPASAPSITHPAGSGIFPPEQIQQLQEQLRQPPPARPQQPGAEAPTRWSLSYLQQVSDWLKAYSLSGIWRVLAQLDIRYKRGRHSLYSPDPDYPAKRDYAQGCVTQALENGPRIVTLYLDELSYYRQPTLAAAYCRGGARHQPLARLSHRSNTCRRILGALDVVSGRVLWQQADKIRLEKLAAFYSQIRAAYPTAETIYVIQDNWPNHRHPTVAAAAQAARVQMVFLPTYAPWLNPIEKLWLKLKQRVLHLHWMSDAWERLQQRVTAFLDSFASGSLALLRYVGLAPKLLPG
jgi:transposase